MVGICLHDSAVFWQANGKLKQEHFTNPRLGRIWKAMLRCGETGNPINQRWIPLMIQGDAGEDTPLTVFLAALFNDAPPPSEAEIEVETVVHLANKRALVDSLEKAKHEILDMDVGVPAEHMKDVGIRVVSAAFNGDTDSDMMEYHQWGDRVFQKAAKNLQQGEQGSIGLNPGLRGIQEVIGRLLGGKLIVIAGMSSSGKSALARQMMESASQDAMAKKLGWGYVSSLEMTGEEYATRSIAEEMHIAASDIEQGSLNQSQVEALGNAVHRMKKFPLIIDSRPRQSIENIRARALKVKNTKGLSIMALDHLLLIKGGPKESLMDRVSEATIECKNMAKEFDIPILLLAQLDEKKIMESTFGFPNSTHLFGGQTIMQNADIVMFVHRPEVVLAKKEPAQNARNKGDDSKDEKSPWAKWDELMRASKGKAWIYNNKRRGGAGNTRTEMLFDGPTMVFSDP